MNSEPSELHALIHAYLDGQATAEQTARLNALLRSDAAAREAYLQLADTHSCLAVDEQLWIRQSPRSISLPTDALQQKPRWLQWRPPTVAAAGIVFGMFCTSVVWAISGFNSRAVTSRPLPVADGSFESGRAPGDAGPPMLAGVWSGDFSAVSTGEQGINPFEGGRMLKFLRADNRLTPPGGGQVTSEMWQVVDLTGQHVQVAELSARFNAIASAATERTAFAVCVCAFNGSAAEAPELWRGRNELALAQGEKEELADSDPKTWQRVVTQVTVPPEANLLLIQVRVTRKGKEPQSPEFGGHFVDAVSLHALEIEAASTVAKR